MKDESWAQIVARHNRRLQAELAGAARAGQAQPGGVAAAEAAWAVARAAEAAAATAWATAVGEAARASAQAQVREEGDN